MLNFLISETLITDANAILKKAYANNWIEYSVSGSSSQLINGSIKKTKPEYAFDQIDKSYDWCSNCPDTYDEHPFMILSVKNKKMNLQGYYLKAGCCDTSRCCCYETVSYSCMCCLFSWSFQISEDNSTWTTIHKVEKDYDLRECKEKTFHFSKPYQARYIRLIQDEACPGDPPCIALNKIELIGGIDGDDSQFGSDYDNDEEDVSIIGHISKNA